VSFYSEHLRAPLDLLVDPTTGAASVQPVTEIAPSREFWAGRLPALYPEWLGDPGFLATHGVRFAYVAGAMANGISTADLVIEMARAEMLGFFGAAGLPEQEVERGLQKIIAALGGTNHAWGANLIHSPNEPALETAVAELFLRRGVRRISASAYMQLTPAIVRVAAKGLHRTADGRIARQQFVFAKVSRPEVAIHFMRPAPEEILSELVRTKQLTQEEASLAREIPLASDITAEADSGGHTDHRPFSVLLPSLLQLRDQIEKERGQIGQIRVGAAGGLGTPQAVSAAFAMGAAYVVTGSVNQSAVESGLSVEGKKMLATVGLADVGPAAAADMFEQGVTVQVLTRGTMFASRANKLSQYYRGYGGLAELPLSVVEELERSYFHEPLSAAWTRTADFWRKRDPSQLKRAELEPKHQMALLFRAYLGLSSRWAIQGDSARRLDFQIWCGPAMGGFNDWANGSFLEAPENRTVVQIARNLMEGAAVITRAHQLQTHRVPLAPDALEFTPRPLS